MRTSILLGLVYIGDAIGKPEYVVSGNPTIPVFAIALVAFAIMDIADFFKNK